MVTIDEYNFKSQRALVRVDFNVPLNEKFEITDDTRMRAAVPTIKKILSDGGSVVLMSHLGRPKAGYVQKYSLAHIVKHLEALLGTKVYFGEDCIGEQAYRISEDIKPGEVLLLENLRFYPEETKGDEEFAQKLAAHGDVYVNDAFGAAHRAHASTAIIADYFADKVVGYLMQSELDNADRVLNNAQKPFTAIMGGAKISDKILVIERLLDRVDNLLIGGAMAYTFFKAQGGKIGNSLVEEDKLPLALELIEKAKAKGVKLMLPVDSVVADAFSADANTQIADNMNIPDGWMGLDIAGKSVEEFAKVIEASKTVLWNGPMGVFEMEKFAKGTIAIAEAVVKATEKGGFSLIGGGDSAAAVNNLGYGDRVSYVSTGGGALLEYMEGKELPGVSALED
jgi:phosphoglycerate kinase